MHTLYGDGVHDDYPAIQELIDSGVCEVSLPVPEKFYLISQSLVLPSDFRLVLPRFAEIRLADGANCVMVRNKMTSKPAERFIEGSGMDKKLFYFVNDYSPDPEDTVRNIEIVGGIWNCNNLNQNPNPIQTQIYEPYGFTGIGMLFYNVRDFRLADLTIKDPTNFAVTMDRVSYFTVENITFDFNYGNPFAGNMDGIHLDGNCHFGVIRNLKGACYDDLVALNADEGSNGPITNLQIDGIFAEDCHSAVRLLTVRNKVENIHISNVYGTYFQYCIGISKYYPGETTGCYDALTFDNIYASKAERDSHDEYRKKGSYVFPLIWMQNDTIVKNLKIENLHRREQITPVETIHVGTTTAVDSLILDNVTTENFTGEPMSLLVNHGHIRRLTVRNISAGTDEAIVNQGVIDYTNK